MDNLGRIRRTGRGKEKDTGMKNTGYILAGAGLIGSMCGASALDGPDMAAGIVVTLAGLAALGAGDLLIKVKRKEAIRYEATEKACSQRKEDTFRRWINSGRLDG